MTVPALQSLTDELADLVAAIKEEHAQARLSARTTLEHAIRAGELLLEAKKRLKGTLGHGYWGRWLAQHCEGMSERTAQAYMQLAAHRPEIEANPQAPAEMTIEAALQMLAKPGGNKPDHEPKGERQQPAKTVKAIASDTSTVAETSADARKAAHSAAEQQLDNVAEHADFSAPDEPAAETVPSKPVDAAKAALCWLILASSPTFGDPELAGHLATAISQPPEPIPLSAVEQVITVLAKVAVKMRIEAEPAAPAHPLDVPPFLDRNQST